MKNGLYELVVAPADYPGPKYRDRYMYEHTLVWWQNTGEVVCEPYVIHHKNGQKRDNDFTNLQRMHRARHDALHSRERMLPLVEVICAYCESAFYITGNHLRMKLRAKSLNIHCSRSCSVKNQWRLGLANPHRGCRAA
jgi:HNH endonuclease